MLQHPSMLPGHPGSRITVPLSSLEALQPVQSIPTGQPGCILVRTESGQYQVFMEVGHPVSVVPCLPPTPVSARKRKRGYHESEPPSKVTVLLDDSDSGMKDSTRSDHDVSNKYSVDIESKRDDDKEGKESPSLNVGKYPIVSVHLELLKFRSGEHSSTHVTQIGCVASDGDSFFRSMLRFTIVSVQIKQLGDLKYSLTTQCCLKTVL